MTIYDVYLFSNSVLQNCMGKGLDALFAKGLSHDAYSVVNGIIENPLYSDVLFIQNTKNYLKTIDNKINNI